DGETLVQTLPVVLAYTDSGLTNGQPYFYKVTAKNAVGQGPRSNEATATPAAGQTVPSAPRSLSAVPGDGLIGLTWLAPSSDGGSPITTYTFYRGTNSGNQSYSVQVGTVTSYTDTALSNGQRYYYVVTAVNALGESPPSSEVSAKPATVPNAPGNLQAIPGNGNVTIQWSGAANNGAP